jgi:hypothetical protein
LGGRREGDLVSLIVLRVPAHVPQHLFTFVNVHVDGDVRAITIGSGPQDPDIGITVPGSQHELFYRASDLLYRTVLMISSLELWFGHRPDRYSE